MKRGLIFALALAAVVVPVAGVILLARMINLNFARFFDGFLSTSVNAQTENTLTI